MKKTVDQDFQVLPATPDDAAGIANVQREAWLATYPNEEHGITRQDIEAKYTDEPARIERRRKLLQDRFDFELVAKDGKKVVGWVSAVKSPEAKLKAIYVLPNYQGRGIGAKLMEEALEWLGDEHDVSLGVASYNFKTIEFYKKWGFLVKGGAEEEASILPNGKIIPVTGMVRKAKL